MPAVVVKTMSEWVPVLPELSLPQMARLVEIAATGDYEAKKFAKLVLERALAPPLSVVAVDNAGKANGGYARAKALSPERRKEIARKAAAARWNA